MNSAISERVELAKLCSSRDWSKAIRVLDSLLSQSCATQDICNRAFCYSQLELHKHVVKDCDKALQLDPRLLQAYILKGIVLFSSMILLYLSVLFHLYCLMALIGSAFSALGRKDDAIAVWEQGYEHALRQSADLKQLLELEELLSMAKPGKQDLGFTSDNHVADSKLSTCVSLSGPHIDGKLNNSLMYQNEYNTSRLFREHSVVSNFCNTHTDNFDTHDINSDGERSKSSLSLSELLPDRYDITCESFKNRNVLGDGSKLSMDSADASDNNNICRDNFCLGSSDLTSTNQKLCGLTNGTHNNFDTPSYASDSGTGLSEKSEHCSESSASTRNSSDITESHSLPNNTFDPNNEISDESKRSKKFCVAKISKTKSINVDFRLSRGIAQVNEGKYAYAVSIFDQAIQSKPSAGEAWKRRGQARAALGESLEAIEDLTKALEFDPDSADILHERGIVNFKFKDFDAAVEDLSACVKLDESNKSAYTYLGMALSSIGEHKRAEEAHLKSIQLDRSFLEAWAHLTQFYQDLAISEKAFDCLQQVIQIDERYAKAYHLRGLLLHGMGEHRKAIKDLSIGLSIENSNIECLYLRASCYHAIGEYADAVKDYDAALDVELDSMDKFVLQCLAFYQKEIALYTASKVNSEFSWFDVDGDIDPLFKEYWCKRLHPKNVCEKVFRQPPLRDSLKKGKLKKQYMAVTKHKTALILAADSIGKKIQYDCPGFLPNKRQLA
ncbi:Suppressor of RPS4-RLD 1 [Hibiscus syriacus]|uniref:Suppressor of RPS4-RLD 1 n=1 Tax=Hibiscus syriacus TaxID=106335 RepID=A0A6A2XAP2_HIBSY|nr:Suppressor of RPS4-RLD 1 [Hibiscus syriacus]